MALLAPHISTPSDASCAFLKTRWRRHILTPRTCVGPRTIILETPVDSSTPVLELVGPNQILTTRKTDDSCVYLLQKYGTVVTCTRFEWADVVPQPKILAASSKYDPRRILVSEKDAIVCSPCPSSRSFRLKTQTKPTKTE